MTTEQQEQIRLLKLRFEALEALEMEGAFVRSRVEYLEKGERSNNYFFDLERATGASKQNLHLRDRNEVLQKRRDDVVDIVHSFNSNLCESEPTCL